MLLHVRSDQATLEPIEGNYDVASNRYDLLENARLALRIRNLPQARNSTITAKNAFTFVTSLDFLDLGKSLKNGFGSL